MAVKSYMDKIKTNWDDLAAERQTEIKTAWNDYRAELFTRRINEQPPEQQKAVFDAVVNRLSVVSG